MLQKPIIGIIGKNEPVTENDLWHRTSVVDELRYLVVRNNGIAVALLPTEKSMCLKNLKSDKDLTYQEIEDLYRQLDFCDGFILQGGLCSYIYEIEIIKKILELDKPILGICDGFNNMLRALGTNVIFDETRSHNHFDHNFRHKIHIQTGTKLYSIVKHTHLNVNSIHSMIATKELVDPFATISSYSEDGFVESFELENKKFAIGLKWHPELLLEETYVDRLFQKFIARC